MQVPFTASDLWINSTVRQSLNLKLPSLFALKQPSRCYELMLPFLCHKAMTSEDEFLRARNSSDTSSARRLISGFPCDSVREFQRVFGKLTGLDASLRNGGMRLNSVNPITSDFTPPVPSTVVRALPLALKRSYVLLDQESVGERRVGVALAIYFLLLTLHPFTDGNGRAARFYFAACIGTEGNASPTLLLALAMMHRHQSTAFHLAASVARMGQLATLLDLYSHSVIFVQENFGSELRALDDTQEDPSTDVNETLKRLLDIRSKLSTYLFV